MAVTPNSILALDVGARRVGVAVATVQARLPRPLITLIQDDTFFGALESIIEVEGVRAVVVGFPRGMQGQHTAQTDAIEAFVAQLKQHVPLPIHMQDEALTSKHAEAELQARGRAYDKGDIDALAATYILDDFLKEHPNIAQEVTS
ncbi:MAG: putative Holliday junction resolvase [Candidatus Saccharibacteria bacterium]|nr:putative Holliday junction resolvase [Candidatus Saccharibacteria bacterium]